MLTREDLEAMRPVAAGPAYGRAQVAVPMGKEQVLMAAPKLALACLSARKYAETIWAEGNFPRGADTGNLIRELDAALAAAGVEVEL